MMTTVEVGSEFQMQQMLVDEAKSYLTPVREAAESDMRTVRAAAEARVSAAEKKLATAEESAANSIEMAHLTVTKGKQQSKITIEKQLVREIATIDRHRLTSKEQAKVNGKTEERRVLAKQEFDRQEAEARATAEKKQELFCEQLDSHLISVERVANLTKTQMIARWREEKKKAQSMMAEAAEKGKQALLTAEQDLTVKTITLQHLKQKHDAAELALSKLKVSTAKRIKQAKKWAAAMVKHPQQNMQHLFSQAKKRMKKMQKEMRQQEEQVSAVTNMYKVGQEQEEAEMGFSAELVELSI